MELRFEDAYDFDKSHIAYYSKDNNLENLGISFWDVHRRDLGTVDFLLNYRTKRLLITNEFYDIVVFKVRDDDTLDAISKLSSDELVKLVKMNYEIGCYENRPVVYPLDVVHDEIVDWLKQKEITPDTFKEYMHHYLQKHWKSFDAMVDDILSYFYYEVGFNLKFTDMFAEKSRMFDLTMHGIDPNYASKFVDFEGVINPRYYVLQKLLQVGLKQVEDGVKPMSNSVTDDVPFMKG